MKPISRSNSQQLGAFAGAQECANKLNTPNGKILILRVLVATSLVVAAAVIAGINYTTFTRQEENFAVDQYNSISAQAFSVMTGSFNRMSKGALMMAKAYAYANPNTTDWPYISMAGFTDMATHLGELASIDNFLFIPIVLPSQRSKFVPFMLNVLRSDPTMPNIDKLPVSKLGIFKFLPNGQPAPDFDGYVPPESYVTTHNNILMPALQVTFSKDLPPVYLGLNGHSLPLFGVSLDWTIDCVLAQAKFMDAYTSCGFFSNVVPLPAPTPEIPNPTTENMQSFITYPIALPDAATGKGKMVGGISGAVNWATLLSRAVPAYVVGLDCVVTTSKTAFTYSMVNGIAVFIGAGDLHDRTYTHYARTIDLLSESRGVVSFTQYQLTFYPRQTFFETYTTDAPFVTTAVMIASILFCCFVFGVYDFLISRESTRKELVLDTKRRFVRFISHEIRTPLNTVRLGLKLLEMEFESLTKQLNNSQPANAVTLVKDYLTSWRQLADDILGNSDSAVDVLNDLLNYDKIEMGTLRLEFSSVAICGLVKKTAAAFVMQAKQKGIDLQLLGECWGEEGPNEAEENVWDLLRVVGDSTRIAQVLRNLISNALKFTPEHGKVTISVDWQPDAMPEKHLRLAVPADQSALLDEPRAGSLLVAVTDSGAGLSPEQLAQICSEGVQFNANQLQAGQGSGLGLYISKGLAEQHGGSLVVTSEGLNQGSTFTMELPVFRVQDTSGGRRRSMGTEQGRHREQRSGKGSVVGGSAKISPDAVGRAEGLNSIPEAATGFPEVFERKRRILVVDDADSNRKLLMRILTAKGYICIGASNGQEALDAYAALQRNGDHADAVLMDFEMPIMDGPTATARLRAMGCRCFIAGVTGNVLPADIDHFKQQGANAVMAKPLNVDVFESLYAGFHVPAVAGALRNSFDADAHTVEGGVVSVSLDSSETVAVALPPSGAENV